MLNSIVACNPKSLLIKRKGDETAKKKKSNFLYSIYLIVLFQVRVFVKIQASFTMDISEKKYLRNTLSKAINFIVIAGFSFHIFQVKNYFKTPIWIIILQKITYFKGTESIHLTVRDTFLFGGYFGYWNIMFSFNHEKNTNT